MGRDGNFLFENGDFVLGKEITVGPLNRKKGDEIGKEDFGSDLAPISVFLENIKEYFPGVSIDDLQLHQTGIQAVLAKKYNKQLNEVDVKVTKEVPGFAAGSVLTSLLLRACLPTFQHGSAGFTSGEYFGKYATLTVLLCLRK